MRFLPIFAAIAFIPALWRRVMDQRVVAARAVMNQIPLNE